MDLECPQLTVRRGVASSLGVELQPAFDSRSCSEIWVRQLPSAARANVDVQDRCVCDMRGHHNAKPLKSSEQSSHGLRVSH